MLPTIISAYAPTLMAEDEVKEHFYSQLDCVLRTIPASDKLVLLGDFNARVGRESTLWNRVIGKEGVGSCNTNGPYAVSTPWLSLTPCFVNGTSTRRPGGIQGQATGISLTMSLSAPVTARRSTQPKLW